MYCNNNNSSRYNNKMETMTKRQYTLQWFYNNFKINTVVRDEINMACPKCGHPRFYFNLKGVGFCHRASCNWKPTLKALAEFKGFELPDEQNWIPNYDTDHFRARIGKQDHQNPKVMLPSGCHPLLVTWEGELKTQLPEEVSKVQERGVSLEQIHKWGFLADKYRIYIPIYEKGELVQYIGRSKWWIEQDSNKKWPKYRYAQGAPISHFFLGWDECQEWSWLTLVENTFVSLWLRESFNCTTNFGSYLSPMHCEKLQKSKVKNVIILWDEDAYVKAYMALEKLHNIGINAKAILIAGQPDDYPKSTIAEIVSMARLSRDRIINLFEDLKR